MKFKVDKDACICCGACAAICEEVFEINDEEGYAVAKDVEVTEEIKDNAINAMEGCPTSAISESTEKEA